MGTLNLKGKKQRGAAAVEFGLSALIFFMLLLGIIEFARLFYLLNSIQEISRRAAREAVVSGFSSSQVDAIKRDAVFRPSSSGEAMFPFGPEITSDNVQIRYLNGSMGTASPMPSSAEENIEVCTADANASGCIQYVETSICAGVNRQGVCQQRITYQPLIGFYFNMLNINLPTATVVMPVEALGYRTS